MEILVDIFVFLFGIIFGSFLNVCIHRFPKEESIVKPGSHCPHCKKPIPWSDNIPLLSFIFLRGRCRHCREKISVRYFAVELASGLIWFFFWRFYGISGFSLAGIILFLILLCVSVTDLETGYIPDEFTQSGMLVGLILCALFPNLMNETVWYLGIMRSGIGLLAGGGSLLALGVVGNFIFRKDSMGGGDIKLMAVMGAFLGAPKVLLVLFAAPIVSIPFALFVKFVKREETIPYGPFLALTGAWFFIYGDQFVRRIFYF